MARGSNKNMPAVMWGTLYTDDDDTGITCGSVKWFEWLGRSARFNFTDVQGTFTARVEKRRNGLFWYAYKTTNGKTHKIYLGGTSSLTKECLQLAASKLVFISKN